LKRFIQEILLAATLILLATIISCKKNQSIPTISSNIELKSYENIVKNKQSNARIKTLKSDPIITSCNGSILFYFTFNTGISEAANFDFLTHFSAAVQEECMLIGGNGSFDANEYSIIWSSTSVNLNEHVNEIIGNAFNKAKTRSGMMNTVIVGDISINATGGCNYQEPPDPGTDPNNPNVPTPEDPCQEKSTVSAKASNLVLNTQKTQILSHTNGNEWGAKQNISSTSGAFNYMTTNIETSNSPDMVELGMNWNSSQGYTIGWAHLHPTGNGPSPQDLFELFTKKDNTQLVASGPQQVDFFKQNASMTIITTVGTYILNIQDWSAMQTKYNAYNNNQSAYITNYLSLVTTIKDEYQISEQEASIRAFTSTFPQEIRVYKAAAGSNDFQPLEVGLDAQGKILVRVKNCPPN